MKGLIAAVREAEAAGAPIRIVHWLETEEARSRVHQVRPVIAWQPWPWELARDWLGLDRPPLPPPLPESVRELLEEARPYLVSSH